MWALIAARNKEFVRDRGNLGWNVAFPFLLLLGLGVILGGQGGGSFKVAVLGGVPAGDHPLHEFFATRQIKFVAVQGRADAERKVSQHRFDLLIDPGTPPRYWVNSTSAKGYVLERVLRGSNPRAELAKQTIVGREVRYLDWFFPGLLGMNIMFGCLFGVGYVIVLYRKNGVLRRLKATPISALEFLTAQAISRLFLVATITTFVYFTAYALFDFSNAGSHLAVLLVFLFGALSMIALGMLIASRTASEELAGGLLNIVTMPMMLLSEVWFSLEGAPGWVKSLSQLLPLTHINHAARAIMTDGRTLLDCVPSLFYLVTLTVAFLLAGASLFRGEA